MVGVGRPTFFRQRIRTEAASIEAKTFLEYLISYIRERREVSLDEAQLIASDAMQYLNKHLGMQKLGQIEFPGVLPQGAHFRRARRDQQEKLVRLTLIQDDDASLLGEFGWWVMVTGRIARVIEEAWYQGALLDINRLCVLFPLNVRAIRERVGSLIEQGALLPLAGMSRATREKFRALRPALAVERYLRGEKLIEIRKSLCVSQGTWEQWWNLFRQVVKLKDNSPSEIAGATGEPEALVKDWLKVWEGLSKEGIAQKVLDGDGFLSWEGEDAYRTRSGFMNLLQKRHGYSPAAADGFAEALREMAQEFSPRLRGPGQVVYIGVSSTEGPGRSLREARLQAVVLDYVTPEDWAKAKRTSPRGLKWSRIERFATQAYAQGAALTLHDIAYLVSASVCGSLRMTGRPLTVISGAFWA